MNYLVDTNIFLEILLGQAGRKKCEAFLRGENAYQFSVARENKLAIATQDKDFLRVRNLTSIRLL